MWGTWLDFHGDEEIFITPHRITPGSTKPLGVPLQGKTKVTSELCLSMAPNKCVHEVLTAQQGPLHLREGLSIGGSTAVPMSWCWGGRKHSKALLQHRMGRRSTQLCLHTPSRARHQQPLGFLHLHPAVGGWGGMQQGGTWLSLHSRLPAQLSRGN